MIFNIVNLFIIDLIFLLHVFYYFFFNLHVLCIFDVYEFCMFWFLFLSYFYLFNNFSLICSFLFDGRKILFVFRIRISCVCIIIYFIIIKFCFSKYLDDLSDLYQSAYRSLSIKCNLSCWVYRPFFIPYY